MAGRAEHHAVAGGAAAVRVGAGVVRAVVGLHLGKSELDRTVRGVAYEDAAQEVFLVVRRKLDSFAGPSMAAWLYGITRKTVSDYRRRAFMRRLLRPILKLFFNPNPMIEALHIQSRLNDSYNHSEALYYELIHNLVLETTRLGIEVKNLKMRVESMSSRLDFDERRARALEGVVQYRPGAVAPLQPPPGNAPGGPAPAAEGDGSERRARRRRRRGRRRPDTRPGAGGSEGQEAAGGDEAGGFEPGDAPETGPAPADEHDES